MCFIFFFISLASAFSFINCENTVIKLNITDSKGEPCYTQLEILAEKNCSKLKRFLVGAPSVSWFQAKVNCEKFGYKLASISSKEENENIMKQLKNQGLATPMVWTALNDLAKENQFVWASNAKLDSSTYLNWYAGEPNNDNDDEDCVNLYSDGSFNDYNCFTNMQYVCEYYTVDHCH